VYILIGLIIVIVSVVGGFLLAKGQLLVLFQPAEFVVICGAAAGAFVIGTPIPIIKKIFRAIGAGVRGKKDHGIHMDLLRVLYELAMLVRKEGILAIEQHVENPQDSQIMKRVLQRKGLADFMCDSLRLVLLGIPTEELVVMLDSDVETRDDESHEPHDALAAIADSLPGLGIVAAVLGIIITMGSIGGDSAAVGKHVAAALVGTFLGVLLCYGFLAPLARVVKTELHGDLVLIKVARTGILSLSVGANPIMICESARRSIPVFERPEFKEMEDTLRAQGK
jgi:chemotaxis protein MotA